jgi:carbamoyl-phosphate synthase large subunit
LTERGIKAVWVEKLGSKKEPNIRTLLETKKIDLVINLAHQYEREVIDDDYTIRRLSVDFNVPLITNLQLAVLFFRAIQNKDTKDLLVKPWSDYR